MRALNLHKAKACDIATQDHNRSEQSDTARNRSARGLALSQHRFPHFTKLVGPQNRDTFPNDRVTVMYLSSMVGLFRLHSYASTNLHKAFRKHNTPGTCSLLIPPSVEPRREIVNESLSFAGRIKYARPGPGASAAKHTESTRCGSGRGVRSVPSDLRL